MKSKNNGTNAILGRLWKSAIPCIAETASFINSCKKLVYGCPNYETLRSRQRFVYKNKNNTDMCIIKLKFHSDYPNEECRLDYVMTILKRFYHSGKMTPMQYRTFKGEVCHGYVKHFYNWCSKRGYDVKTLERRYSHRYYDYANILVTMIEKSPEISAICDLEKKYPELINGGVENERNQTE